MESPMDWVLNPTEINLPQYARDMQWVVLGKEILQEAVIEGEELISEAVYGDHYLIDVLWLNGKERSSWAQYRVTPENPVHFFWGKKPLYDSTGADLG